MNDKCNIFPMFLNINEKNVLVIGAGKIASRRIITLLKFNCNLTVVAKTFDEKLSNLKFNKIEDSFKKDHLTGIDIAIIATNDAKLNEFIYYLCKSKNILTNVSSNASLCDFYFPAIIENQEIIGGIVSKTGDKHKLVKETAEKLRGNL